MKSLVWFQIVVAIAAAYGIGWLHGGSVAYRKARKDLQKIIAQSNAFLESVQAVNSALSGTEGGTKE